MSEGISQSIPLLSIEVEDLQIAAQREIGRVLSGDELLDVVAFLRSSLEAQIEWDLLLKLSVVEVQMRFARWMEQVDQAVWRMAACSVYALPNMDFYLLFSIGSTPEQTADAVLMHTGFNRFDQGHAAQRMNQPLFLLGQVVATPGAVEALEQARQNAIEFLERHQGGDWGIVPEEDKVANSLAVKGNSRILSAYRLTTNVKIWVITEADRSVTTLLLPEEY